MLGRLLAIARNTFRENIRDKILYNLILFALIMILSSLALGQLTLGNEDKVILDLGLSSISIFGMLIAIFIGIRPGLQGTGEENGLRAARKAGPPI